MALLPCASCGARISDKAKTCPQCGHPVPKKTSTTAIVVSTVFGIAILASIVGSMNRQDEKDRANAAKVQAEQARVAAITPEQKAREELAKKDAAATERRALLGRGANYACQEFVRKSLHDPSSADFDDYLTFWSKREKNGDFHVQAHLRARNGFNALRAMVVDCWIRPVGDDYALVRLKEQ